MAILVAHRGFRSAAGENRMIDFENALKICPAVEFDIRLTKDNQVIIFHDDTFKRIAHQDVSVHDLTYQAIKELEFFKQNPTATPPLFLDFITKLSSNYQMINVEIKEEINRNYTSKELDLIFSTIKKLLDHTKAEVIVSSFNHAILNEINHRISQPMKKGYLFETQATFNEKYGQDFNYIHPGIATALNPEMIAKLKSLNKPLNIWTFQTNEEAAQISAAYQNQVYGFISDNPDLKIKN
ncbi:glycerophosphodiester phosphodiesterase [Spiroplasma platyhelix]|uniref:Glycerophosphodiester phosphodiesterase n=1 Tax=Spiroplasma platyhelix PALS-1 TaxID=1276218 RepID=A0A846U1T8_9MOLU|nr:glycerophosphodiester phosphodiesterase family protein [Spiroplasma platyhelix]MBE4704384.1 hypothetical protein [Spiroplasma platyhelix PALS-1]NKE38756.1 glycerophosphodiester phosphodiesterase [Spiroplasma platyhelix PALS-1]UJB28967.1 glycerophosphoryl diester phosphodiesterase [Spiroplasma platyhelix PALS-1]